MGGTVREIRNGWYSQRDTQWKQQSVRYAVDGKVSETRSWSYSQWDTQWKIQPVRYAVDGKVSETRNWSYSQWDTQWKLQSVIYAVKATASEIRSGSYSQWDTQWKIQSVRYAVEATVSEIRSGSYSQWDTQWKLQSLQQRSSNMNKPQSSDSAYFILCPSPSGQTLNWPCGHLAEASDAPAMGRWSGIYSGAIGKPLKRKRWQVCKHLRQECLKIGLNVLIVEDTTAETHLLA